MCSFNEFLHAGISKKIKSVKTNGDKIAEEAALKAIEAASPIDGAEKILNKDEIEIEFTFDYKVFSNAKENNTIYYDILEKNQKNSAKKFSKFGGNPDYIQR